jgi:membrane protease YdiL (CAAX protease family)
MRTGVLGLLLICIVGFFSPGVQSRLRRTLHQQPAGIWAAPLVLTAWFAGVAGMAHAFSWILVVGMLVYTSAPVLCVFVSGPGFAKTPNVLDFAAILLLWLPIEFGVGAGFVPLPARGYLHTVAYGIAILLGLTLFLGFRSLPGMKYNLPQKRSDLWWPIASFALLAPVLAVIGILIGFLPLPHWPVQPAGAMASGFGIILVATALPEEILFRSLIQNLLMLRFGSTNRTLLLASVIFGCAHLDNGPQALPNWRYAVLATIAGWAYGKVFQRSTTVLSSATLHALVDWTKHFVF